MHACIGRFRPAGTGRAAADGPFLLCSFVRVGYAVSAPLLTCCTLQPFQYGRGRDVGDLRSAKPMFRAG